MSKLYLNRKYFLIVYFIAFFIQNLYGSRTELLALNNVEFAEPEPETTTDETDEHFYLYSSANGPGASSS